MSNNSTDVVDSSDVYDITKYTDDEMYDILGLSNPTDRELEITINNRIDSFSNGASDNEEYLSLSIFFKAMLDHFFKEEPAIEEPAENTNDNNTSALTTTQSSKNLPMPLSVPEASVMANMGMGMGSSVSYTYPFQYTTGNVNSLKRQTITRMISINSADRDRDIYPTSTSFLCNLSENLTDVVNIRMSSVKIPNTWYTVADGYGGNFFYITGNSPGLTSGTYDWKISIIPGNYTEETIISSINDSLTAKFATIADIDFVSNANNISYNSINKKATFAFNFNQYYNESYYYINFPVFTSPYINYDIYPDPERDSIPGLLGLCKNTYSLDTIYSTYALAEDVSDVTYTLSETNAAFSIYIYTGPENFDGSTYLDKIDISFTDVGEKTRSEIIELFNAVLLSESKLTGSSFSEIDASYRFPDFNETLGVSLCLKYNRYSSDTVNSYGLKTAVVFPDDSEIWIGEGSCFGFETATNEVNDIVSERGKIFNKYEVSSNPYILFKCVKSGYADIDGSKHDISFGVPNGVYTLFELFKTINENAISANEDSGINNTFNCVYNIPTEIEKGDVPAFGINIYREFDNPYFTVGTTMGEDAVTDVSNLLFGSKSFFDFKSVNSTGSVMDVLYTCDISHKDGYGLLDATNGYSTSITISGEDIGYFSSDFAITIDFDMVNKGTIIDIVGSVNSAFLSDLYNPVETYSVYFGESVITAGNKKTNVEAIRGVKKSCGLIATTLNNILTAVNTYINNNSGYDGSATLIYNFEIILSGFTSYGSDYFDGLMNELISSTTTVNTIQPDFLIGKTALLGYISSLITYMDYNNGIGDAGVSYIYSASNESSSDTNLYNSYPDLLTLITELKAIFLIYNGDTDGIFTDSLATYDEDDYNFILNMGVNMSVTNDDYLLYFCDPSSAIIDTVDGGGVDSLGVFTDSTTNFWKKYLNFSAFSYDLSAGEGPYVSYKTTISSSGAVYENYFYLTSENNYFYIRAAYDMSGGVYTAEVHPTDDLLYYNDIRVDLGLTVNVGYSSYEIVAAIQSFFDGNEYLKGSTISLDTDDTAKTTIRLCVSKTYSAIDYNLVFYDNTLYTTCKNTLSSAVKKVTWDTTIGWMLGFRKLTSYPLSLDNLYYDADTDNTYYNGYLRSIFLYNSTTGAISLTADTTVSVNLYSYFMIILDDFNQNHLNDGLITITNRDTSVPLPAYTSKSYIQCDATTGEKYIGDINSNTTSNKLTANQIYAANQKLVSNTVDKGGKIFSYGLYAKDMIALLPNTNTAVNQSDSYLNGQERFYFGPVCLSRFKIQLLNDRGTVVDLNGSDWGFVLTAEILYSEL